jgi:hypothetical protein
MARPNTYPRKLRERAIHMVAELRHDYPSEHAAMTRWLECSAPVRPRHCAPGFVGNKSTPGADQG